MHYFTNGDIITKKDSPDEVHVYFSGRAYQMHRDGESRGFKVKSVKQWTKKGSIKAAFLNAQVKNRVFAGGIS